MRNKKQIIRNSKERFINEGLGPLLDNVGDTLGHASTIDFLRNYDVGLSSEQIEKLIKQMVGRLHRRETYIPNSIKQEYKNFKEMTKK